VLSFCLKGSKWFKLFCENGLLEKFLSLNWYFCTMYFLQEYMNVFVLHENDFVILKLIFFLTVYKVKKIFKHC
jgi:hypothetical protein